MRPPPPYKGPTVPYEPDAPDANARFGRWPKRWLKASSRFAQTIDVQSKHGPMRGQRRDITGMGKYLRTGQWHGDLDVIMGQIASAGMPGPVDLLVNVGANIGTTIIPMLRHGFAQRAIGLEPEPNNVALLRHNLEANGLAEHVAVIAAAAGRAPGVLPFDVSPSNKGDHRFGGDGPPPRGWVRIEAPVVRLDDALGHDLFEGADPSRTLTWMDIQGAEPLAIDGAGAHFEKAPLLIAEFNPRGMAHLGASKESVAKTYGRWWNRLRIADKTRRWRDASIADLPALWESLGENGGETDILLWRT